MEEKYQIKCPDGKIYKYGNAEEVLRALCNLLSDGHKYRIKGEWNNEWVEG